MSRQAWHTTVLAVLVAARLGAGEASTAHSFHLSFDDFGFLEHDFVARGGRKTVEERGMSLEPGRFGQGLRMNLTPHIDLREEMSGADLDQVTGAMFRTWRHREVWTIDNEPFLWGAGRFNPGSGAVAFWLRGPLTEADVLNQSAMAWGRSEKHLLAITVDADGHLGAHLVDARYARHEIGSQHEWDAERWNHVALNWDRAHGLELLVNGEVVASSWGRDAWWQTMPPGLFHLPMPHVVYDELHLFSRPLTRGEIARLAETNEPPATTETAPRTPADRDRLARAFGLTPNSPVPVLEPLDEDRALAVTEVVPEFVGDDKIPAFFVRDGRYELAWPHPQDVFTPIPGDAAFQAEKLDVEVAEPGAYNYVTIEGHMAQIPAALVDARRNEAGLFEGDELFELPRDERFFYATKLASAPQRFLLPFVQGFGAPPRFEGDLHLPLTGDTRVHEVGLFDVAEAPYAAPRGELSYFLRRSEPALERRYDLALRTLFGLSERQALLGLRTPPEDETWVDTGLLRRLHLITAPMSRQESVGAILLDLQVRTQRSRDLLVVRLRDPGLPHRIWTHAEVRLQGFDGDDGGRLRLLLEPPPIIMPAGDRIWIDVATYDDAAIGLGGESPSRLVLVPAPRAAAAAAYEAKGLLPVIAEATKAHYQPWSFEQIPPDVDNPHSLGGHFDSVMPALAVSRVLPYSVIAQDYLHMAGVLPAAHDSSGLAVQTRALPATPADVPEWAHLQHELKGFRTRVVDWMVDNQNADGQIGEGWNDDVFLLVGRWDVPLDGHLEARDMYLRLFEGLDATNQLGDGYVRIAPLDYHHTEDLYSMRFQALLLKLGDPYIVRRALQTAWHHDKPEQTPQYYFDGRPFVYDRNVLRWYWGQGARFAYASPAEGSVLGSLRHHLRQADDIRFHRYTEAWNARRGGEGVITGMVLGGWNQRMRNPKADDLSISVAWPRGGGVDLAQWVTAADSASFTCRLFSFGPLPRSVTAQLLRLDPGTYEITVRAWRNREAGDTLSTARQALQRYDTIDVEVPPGDEVVLSVTQVEPAAEAGPLPDLAVAAYDCERTGSRLRVRVSNLGSAAAPPTRLSVHDATGQQLAQTTVPDLPAPTDFVERSVWVEVEGLPESGELVVVADAAGSLQELYRGNNRATVPERR
jgi:hypothetical protein